MRPPSAYCSIDGVEPIVSDVYVECFDAGGNPAGRARKANDAAAGRRDGPAVAMNRSGECVVAWQDSRNGAEDIYFQRYGPHGYPQGTHQAAGDAAGTAAPYPPAAVIGENGRCIVAWSDQRAGSESPVLIG